MEKQTFAMGMAELSGAFRTEITTAEMGAYWNALCQCTNDSWIHAVRLAVTTQDKFPIAKTLKDLSRTYRVPMKQIENDPIPCDLEYGKDRMAIINRILDGQTNRETAKQLSALIDKYPQRVDTLSRQAQEWWDKPDGEAWPT